MIRMIRVRFHGAGRVGAVSLLLALPQVAGHGTVLAARPGASPTPADVVTPPLFLDFAEHFLIDIVATGLIVY
ncbi:MAG: hypothetical protein ACRDG4_19175, partial [Chloroflexota bacterium]